MCYLQQAVIDGNNDITKKDTVKEEISNDDISSKRLKKIKGFLKRKLLNQDDDAAIDGETMGVKDTTVMEVSLCAKLVKFLSPFVPPKKERNWISTQLPLLLLANKFFNAFHYSKFKVNICPKSLPSQLLCLPLDTTLLYTLLTNFDQTKYRLICKDRYPISTIPTALKKKNDVFGAIFDMEEIKKTCSSRKLSFVYQIVIRPSMYTCVLTANRFVNRKVPEVSEDSPKESPEDIQKAKQNLNSLEMELQEMKKSFNLIDMDQEIKTLKLGRKAMSTEKEREAALAEIKNMKRKRWTGFKTIKDIDLRIKRAKCRLFITSAKDKHEGIIRQKSPLAAEKMIFSGSDYGLQTMSVTVRITNEMYNSHISYYNAVFPENTM